MLYALAAIAFIAYMLRKLLKAGIRLDHLKAGYDAEVAVGQELDQLMRQARRPTPSELVLASATDAARRMVDEHATIRLARREQEAFVAAHLDPPAATAGLLRAAHAYRRGQKDTR